MGLTEGTTIVNIELLRERAVLAAWGISHSTFMRELKAGVCTPPVKIGCNSFWPRHEINEILRAAISGATQEQRKRLVLELVEQRKAMTPPSMRETEAA